MAEEQADNAPQQQFAIQKLYVKDLSFETPNSPDIFTQQWNPEINLNMNTDSRQVSEGIYEVVLDVTVTAKAGDNTAYLCEAKQAGVFTITGLPEEQLSAMLGAYCPNVLYPYAREVVSDLVAKGGFPQLFLAPVNFDALYQQKISEVNAQVQQPGQGGAAH